MYPHSAQSKSKQSSSFVFVGLWVDLRMNYFWVNQGQTWKDEYEGDF